jgi:hypothetical protein
METHGDNLERPGRARHQNCFISVKKSLYSDDGIQADLGFLSALLEVVI